MIVNGKYRFDIGSAGGAEQALQLADKLVDKERAANQGCRQLSAATCHAPLGN